MADVRNQPVLVSCNSSGGKREANLSFFLRIRGLTGKQELFKATEARMRMPESGYRCQLDSFRFSALERSTLNENDQIEGPKSTAINAGKHRQGSEGRLVIWCQERVNWF
jgi:hypothetical protein